MTDIEKTNGFENFKVGDEIKVWWRNGTKRDLYSAKILYLTGKFKFLFLTCQVFPSMYNMLNSIRFSKDHFLFQQAA